MSVASQSTTAPVIAIEDVRKTFLTGKVEVHALQGVNLRIERGDSVAIMGPSGSGKTTLLRRARFLLEEKSGEVAGDHERRAVRTLWFNAWKYPTEDTVLAGLLGALLDELRKGTKAEQFKVLVNEYAGSGFFEVLKHAAPATLKSLFEIESRFEPAESKRAFHDTFRELFGQLAHLRAARKLRTREEPV